MRKKKTIGIILFTFCLLLLTGWGEKSVELLDDIKLIDLSKAIKEVPIGKQGNTSNTKEPKTESVNNHNKEISDKKIKKDKIYIIEIRNEKIIYNKKEYDDVNELKKKIIDDYSSEKGSVSLVDNYAEVHLYNEVLNMLEQLHETIGLVYNSD